MAAAKLAEEWDEVLTTRALDVLQHSGLRLGQRRSGDQEARGFLSDGYLQQTQAIDRQFDQVKPLRDGLATAQAQCASGGGFKLFGGGGPRALRAFVALLGQFARMRVAQDLLEAGLLFYRSLQGRLEDRIKDLAFSGNGSKHSNRCLPRPVRNSTIPTRRTSTFRRTRPFTIHSGMPCKAPKLSKSCCRRESVTWRRRPLSLWRRCEQNIGRNLTNLCMPKCWRRSAIC